MLLYSRVAAPKAPKKRSRAGCIVCREKKKKCDEQRPQCKRCAERDVDCTYEPIKPRQRRRRSTAVLDAKPPTIQPHGSSPHRPARNPIDRARGGRCLHETDCRRWAPVHGLQPDSFDSLRLDDLVPSTPLDASWSGASWNAVSPMAALPGALDLASLSQLSPASLDYCELTGEDDGYVQAVWGAGSPRQHRDSYATTSTATDGTTTEETATDLVARSWSSKTLHPDLAMIAPIPPVSPLLEFRIPAFSEFADCPQRRSLVAHFCNVLSHLIVFREESGNPFQQLVLPLTQRSSAVTNAIYALASAHLGHRHPEGGEKSIYFHSRAIQGLARLIEQGDRANRNELLATIILLVYYEVLVQRERSNIVDGHLKGALTVMSQNPVPAEDPTSLFLERAFRFYDVIAALSNGTAPLSAAPAANRLQPFPPLGAPVGSPLSNVDTLLGMATTLWPIIHRLSSLPPLKAELETAVQANPTSSKVAVLRSELMDTASAIEIALSRWQPMLPPDLSPNDPPPRSTSPSAARIAGTEYEDSSGDDASGDDGGGGDDEGDSGDDGDDGDEDGEDGEDGDDGDDDTKTRPPASPSPCSPDCYVSSPLSTCEATNGAADKTGLHSILHNALAYRHSALVYLYRTIYGLGRSHPAVQRHAHAALANCEATVRARGPMGALLWPLFVAACEAVAAGDREMARRAFEGLERRQGMLNIGRAWEIVGEVWTRADRGGSAKPGDYACEAPLGEYGGGRTAGGLGVASTWGDVRRERARELDLWRRVMKERGVNIVFG